MELYENDNELIYMYRIQSISAEYFIHKYERIIDCKINKELHFLTMGHREEIKQLTLIKLCEIIDTYRHDKHASFHYYFQRVMNNLIADYLRMLHREFQYIQELGRISTCLEITDTDWWYYSNQGKNETYLNITELRIYEKDKLKCLLEQCTPIQKTILYLKLKGYSQKEIAVKLNKKESNISYHMKIIRDIHNNL